jgi:hypothetical protein
MGMSDIVKRLRYEADGAEFSNRYADIVGESADYIEKLEAQLAAADKLAKVCGDVRNTVSTRIALTAYREARK